MINYRSHDDSYKQYLNSIHLLLTLVVIIAGQDLVLSSVDPEVKSALEAVLLVTFGSLQQGGGLLPVPGLQQDEGELHCGVGKEVFVSLEPGPVTARHPDHLSEALLGSHGGGHVLEAHPLEQQQQTILLDLKLILTIGSPPLRSLHLGLNGHQEPLGPGVVQPHDAEPVPEVDQLQARQSEPAALRSPPLRLPDGVLLHGKRLAGNPLLEAGDGGHQLRQLLLLLLGEAAAGGLDHDEVGRHQVAVEAGGPPGLGQQGLGLGQR